MNSPIQQLADRLNDTLGTAHTQPWLWPSLLRLLAHGEPVTLDQLATATPYKPCPTPNTTSTAGSSAAASP